MIDNDLLMRRAIKWVCDEQGVAVDMIDTLPTDIRNMFNDTVLDIAEDMRYNQLKYFRPFEYQKRFFATGAHSDRRGILAANRIGKTVSTAFETAYHLTGLYPDWWEGKRFHKPVVAFVAGEGWDQVARVLQDELLGAKDIKHREDIGTGAIPRHLIDLDSIRGLGANAYNVQIKHAKGAKSILQFGNYTQEVRQLQGFKLDFVVFDEQPPDDTFSELITRTATTQGQVLCSFTPLKGLNGLVSKFWYGEGGYEHIRVAWDDVPEYDLWGEPFLLKKTRQQLERDYLPHEREARISGKPVMGKGAVFPVKNWNTYKTGEFKFKEMMDIERVIALDLGLVNDKTVISYMFWQPDTQEAWLHSQIVVGGTEEANPMSYINHLMRPQVFGCPIVLPADANTQGRYTMSTQSIRELFEEYELNVHPNAVMNPPDANGKRNNHKSFGVNMMRQMLDIETLYINENCVEFLREAQNYYVDEKGRFSDPDDCIDSARYALLGCLNGWSEPYDELTPQDRFKEQRNQINNYKRNASKPSWKQTYS
jgi:phage terminase large subunit-like protein